MAYAVSFTPRAVRQLKRLQDPVKRQMDEAINGECHMEVSLPEDIEQLIHNKVASGEYSSPDEFVFAGIQLLLERDRLFEENKNHWRSQIEEGIRQADAGEVVDGEEFLRSLE